jgi:flagellum-specific ATP synthase
VSRLANEITSSEVRSAAVALRETLAVYKAKEDLISIGAYAPGTDPLVDYAIAKQQAFDAFLRQGVAEGCDAETTDALLLDLMGDRRRTDLLPATL